MTRQQLTNWALDNDIELIFYDPPEYFDHAIVGIVVGFGQEPAVLYDQIKVIAAMAKEMGIDDAMEWFGYNTIGAYMGTNTPRFLTGIDVLDDDQNGAQGAGSGPKKI